MPESMRDAFFNLLYNARTCRGANPSIDAAIDRAEAWFACPFCKGGPVKEQDLGFDRGRGTACDNCHRIVIEPPADTQPADEEGVQE